MFEVGAVVRAKWKGGSTFYGGVVKKVNANGTYAVMYDDGDFDAAVPLSSFEPSAASNTAATKPVSVTMSVGDRVEAKWKGGSTYYGGVVAKVNSDGTYAVKYDDGDFDAAVPSSSFKPGASDSGASTPASASATMAVGDKVQAKWKGGSSYYGGVVAKVNSDGTYAVKYDDGDFDAAVPLSSFKVADQAAEGPSSGTALAGASASFAVGDRVTAKWKGGSTYYGGVVAKVNSNNTYAVKYDDGDFDAAVPLSSFKCEAAEPAPGSSAVDASAAAPVGAPANFAVGARVQAKWKGGSTYYGGVVTKANPDGTFAVKYDDGDFDAAVPVPSFKPAETVEVASKSPIVEAKVPVARVNGEKQFHVFISYRVFSEAPLAESLCDKLQQCFVGKEHVRVRCFLDRQNLRDGEDWEHGFREGLRTSMAFVPLISEAAIGPITKVTPERQDNVLLEYELALKMLDNGDNIVLPLFVGSYGDGDVLKPFDGSHFKWPETHSRTSNVPVSTTMTRMLTMQGIRVDPKNIADKLDVIVSRVGAYAWPRFKGDWCHMEDLEAEERFTCVQCGKEFDNLSNGPGSCEFNTIASWNRGQPVMKRARHRISHHSEYPYTRYFDWALDTVGWRSSAVVFGAAKPFDYVRDSELPGAEVGRVEVNGNDQGKLFVRVNGISWIGLYTPEDLKAIASMGSSSIHHANLDGDGTAWADAEWMFEKGGGVAGILLRCKPSHSDQAMAVKVLFDQAALESGRFQASQEVVHSTDIVEKRLPDGSDVAGAYSLPKDVQRWGETIPAFQTYDAKTFPPDPDPLLPLRCKVGRVGCNDRSRRDADLFDVPLTLISMESKKPLFLLEANARWRYRGEGDGDWHPVADDAGSNVEIISRAAFDDDSVITAFPATLPADGVKTITLRIAVPSDDKRRNCKENWFNRSWIARMQPVELEITFEDKFGFPASVVTEFIQPSLGAVDRKAREDDMLATYVDDVKAYHRHNLVVSPGDSKDVFKVSLPGRSFNFTVENLRTHVYRAEKEGTSEVLAFEECDSPVCRYSAWLLIDLPARRVYACKFLLRSRSGACVAYLPVPAYGAAACADSAVATATPATEKKGAADLLHPDPAFCSEDDDAEPAIKLQAEQIPSAIFEFAFPERTEAEAAEVPDIRWDAQINANRVANIQEKFFDRLSHLEKLLAA